NLERPDPQPRRPQLLTLRRAQPRQLTPVDLLLPPPAVDRLVADLQQPRDLSDRLPRRDQIKRSPAKLRRIALPSHTTSSRGRPSLETRPHGTGATALFAQVDGHAPVLSHGPSLSGAEMPNRVPGNYGSTDRRLSVTTIQAERSL